CLLAATSRNITQRPARTSNSCLIGWRPSRLRFRSSAANYPPKGKKISKRGWTPSSHGGNLGLRRTPKPHLITKATWAEEFFRKGQATAKIVGLCHYITGQPAKRSTEPSTMENLTDSHCSRAAANDAAAVPS